METGNLVKNELILVLKFLLHQLETDSCNEEQIKSWHKLVSDNVKVDASISELADFYDQSESNVRNVINRRMTDKPKRKVMYDWFKFSKIIPSSWH